MCLNIVDWHVDDNCACKRLVSGFGYKAVLRGREFNYDAMKFVEVKDNYSSLSYGSGMVEYSIGNIVHYKQLGSFIDNHSRRHCGIYLFNHKNDALEYAKSMQPFLGRKIVIIRVAWNGLRIVGTQKVTVNDLYTRHIPAIVVESITALREVT